MPMIPLTSEAVFPKGIELESSERAAMPPALRRYVVAVAIAGVGTLLAMLGRTLLDGSFPERRDSVIFLAAIVLSQLPFVVVRRRRGEDEASIAETFAFAALLLFSPAFAAVGIAIGSSVADLRRRKTPTRMVFNIAQYSLSVALAGSVVAVGDARFATGEIGAREIGVAVGAAGVFFAANWVLVGIAVGLSQRSRRLGEFLAIDIGVGSWHSMTNLTQGALAAIVYPRAPWALALFLPASHTIHLAARRYQALRIQARQTMETLAAVLDDRDPTTSEHSVRVSRYAVEVATEMGLSDRLTEEIEKSGLVHDLGKVAIPDAILMKPGPLTPAEMATMHTHPHHGADILGNLEIYSEVRKLVRHHHERWDGRGYPDGLAGQDIPMGSRIITVVDAFDAMTSTRPYREPVPNEDGLEELERCAGTHFDPQVVRVFARLVRARPALYGTRGTGRLAEPTPLHGRLHHQP